MVEKTCLIVTFLGITCAVPVCKLAKLLLAPLEEPLPPAPLEEPLLPAPLAELPPATALEPLLASPAALSLALLVVFAVKLGVGELDPDLDLDL